MFSVLCIFFLVLGIVELFETSVSKKLLAGIALFPAFILTAFRDVSVGCDTIPYYRAFNRISLYDSFSDMLSYERMESGYLAINYIMSHLGFSFFNMQVLISLFIYTAFYVFLTKYSKNIGLSCFLFLTLRYMFGPMNVVRMYMAVAFLLYSISFLQKRNFVPFMILVLVASLFHKTAFVFILLYPLVCVNMRKKNVSIVFIAAGIISFLGKNFFAFFTEKLGIYESYLSGKYFNFEDNVAVYLILLIDICLALLIYFNEKNDNEVVDLENKDVPIKRVWMWSVIFVLCCDIIGLNNTIMGRISGLFSSCWLILIPFVIMQMKNKATAFLVYAIVALCLFVQFETVMIFRPNWNNVEPYAFFFGDVF